MKEKAATSAGGGRIKTVGVLVNPEKPGIEALVRDYLVIARKLGLESLLPEGVVADAAEEHVAETELVARAEAVVAFGGDGTLLYAARRVAPRETPILGVAAGTLGFLTEASPHDLAAVLPKMVGGRAPISERLNLQGSVERGGKHLERFTALNDIVIGRVGVTRLARLEAMVGDEHVGSYLSDGLILSTPTGSTAYSLSAGGPIVSPNLRVVLAVPICPHTLTVRPLVISEEDPIRVEVQTLTGEGLVTVDGQETHPLQAGDVVHVRCAPFTTRLVLTGRSFYRLLRDKFRWGEREA